MKPVIFLLLFSSSLLGQPVNFKVNGRQTNIYNDAVVHYVDSIYNTSGTASDTLFILKNEELTENVFQTVIKKINVSFRDSVAISKRLKYHKSVRALNIGSDQSSGKERINIIVVSFIISNDKGKESYKPFEYCTVRYAYNHSKKEFEFCKIRCDRY